MMRVLAILLLLGAMDEMEEMKVYRVVADLRVMATAVEAYSEEHHALPRAQTIEDLRAALDPRYVQGLRIADPWGTKYKYMVSDDGKHYRIICAGSDAKFEKTYDKMKADGPKQQLTPDATYDIVYQDGTFRVVPEGFEKELTRREVRRVVPFP